MRILTSIAVVLSAGMLFINPIAVSSHSNDVDAQMNKLHAMMPMFSVASAELELALEKGDVVAAKAQADKIQEAAADLKKSKPHKNIKQRKKFVELATKFEETVASTVDSIKKDDLSGAKAAFKKIEKVCAACHAKFRD